MFLEPSKTHRRRRRPSRGFTLIELVVVILIIGITAALASPTLLGQMRERRSRDTAQQIALIYSNARMRALGRGSAVMVRYAAATGFSVMESTEGTLATVDRGQANCVTAPGRGCLTTTWGNAVNSRLVNALVVASNLTVEAQDPLGAAKSQVNVCFTPGGRSFASYDGTNPTMALAGSIGFTVQRGTTGLLRRVALLPNGNARLAL